MEKRIFQLNQLTCPTCAKKIETVLKKTNGVAEVSVAFTSSKVKVEYNETLVEAVELIDKIHRLGYRVMESKKA